ncbi:MAG: hypothetical protein R3D51_03460 [Hyphomicrobiaceae bacterium]
MPSVEARWSGRCRDRQKQDELSRYLKVLAEINHGYWADYPAPIAGINRAMHRAAGIEPLADPTWREFDIPIEGRIVVSGDVVRRGSGDAKECNADLGARLREARLPVFMTETSAVCHTSLPRCRLKGIDLVLFDPRRLFPGNDRLSFVFLSETGCPLLENVTVEVHERGVFANTSNVEADEVDCYLGAPTLHLRYMHEAFLDCLMAWIKWHFVEDLHYWRNEDWPDAALYNDWFADAADKHRPIGARDAIFSKLCDEFIVECDTWIDRAERNFSQAKSED